MTEVGLGDMMMKRGVFLAGSTMAPLRFLSLFKWKHTQSIKVKIYFKSFRYRVSNVPRELSVINILPDPLPFGKLKCVLMHNIK